MSGKSMTVCGVSLAALLFCADCVSKTYTNEQGKSRDTQAAPTYGDGQPGLMVTTLAVSAGMAGSANGKGSAALFKSPIGVAVDASGDLYVADSDNNLIRKITPGGVVTTLAGSGKAGSKDGKGTAASFNHPEGLAIDPSGNLYVADRENKLIRKITPGGVVTSLEGTNGMTADELLLLELVNKAGNNLANEMEKSMGLTVSNTPPTNPSMSIFIDPEAVAVDSSGNLYVADSGYYCIWKITPDGKGVVLAGSHEIGKADGTGSAASFDSPSAIAVDASGNVYVADSGNNLIRKITPGGKVTTLAGSGAEGSVDGKGTAASFDFPLGIAVDASGNIYVADTENNKIRKITRDSVVTTLAGQGDDGFADGAAATALFHGPWGIAVDSKGDIYVADSDNEMIRVIQ